MQVGSCHELENREAERTKRLQSEVVYWIRLVDTFSMITLKHFWIAVTCFWFAMPQFASGDWFEKFKSEASDSELHEFLYEMPKGGDLHLHLSGSGFPEWWYELAIASEQSGYVYYTKVRLNNCRLPNWDSFSVRPYHLMYQTLVSHNWEKLSKCEKGEFVLLSELDHNQKKAFMSSLKLDLPHEGREEFFGAHWQRLGDLTANPFLIGELLAKNIIAFAAEGLLYLEPQINSFGYRSPSGTTISSQEAVKLFSQRIQQEDVVETGVTVRFQQSILRFLPEAEDLLRSAYEVVSNNDLYVAVNMVGREDNDKGHPLRFLSTLRDLRRSYSGVRLSIHGGEVDEPNYHVRDTILLGAERIGHGLNLITDPETMRLMRHGPYLVEINLISNLLLEYVSDYDVHPFPEYLRTGIPVALSTDDRGMWDSTMTDEFFVAIKEFNLTWEEIKQLSRNSLKFAFVHEKKKTTLIDLYERNIEKFEGQVREVSNNGWSEKNKSPRGGFVCSRYRLCD